MNEDEKPASFTTIKRRKFLHESGYVLPRAVRVRERIKNYRILVKEKQLIEKERREQVRAKRVRAAEIPRMEFAKLDQNGSPVISFDPDSPLRDGMCDILMRPARDAERKQLVEKLGIEFGRIYVRYRKGAEAERGKRSIYALGIPEAEQHHAEEAGVQCILKGITPRNLLEYWHKNIRTFADRDMIIAPLALMKSPGMVDQAACSHVVGGAKVPRSYSDASPTPTATPTDVRPVSRNSYASPGALHAGLRRGLERAGFDMRDFNDAYLVTIQNMAKKYATDEDFLPSKQLRPMVVWAAENLFKPEAASAVCN